VSEVKLIPFEARYIPAYLSFAKKHFGEGSYQSTPAYLVWLYEHNPWATRGYRSCLIGLNAREEVIGCVHKMYQRCWRDGEAVLFPAIHNLAVRKNYRTGLGSLLLLSSLGGEEIAFMPGVARHQTQMYERLKFRELKPRWYRSPVRPLRGPYRVLRHKFFSYGKSPIPRTVRIPTALSDIDEKEVRCVIHPSDEDLSSLLSLLQSAGAKGPLSPVWTLDWLKWRFFHPKGPKHILIAEGMAKGAIRGFGLLSVGPHRGAIVARLVHVTAPQSESVRRILGAAKRIARRSGDFMLGYSNDPQLQRWFEETGWHPSGPQPRSYIFSKKKLSAEIQCRVGPESGDFGFEAISTEWN
jgi:hypothetical protein